MIIVVLLLTSATATTSSRLLYTSATLLGEGLARHRLGIILRHHPIDTVRLLLLKPALVDEG